MRLSKKQFYVNLNLFQVLVNSAKQNYKILK